MLKLFKFFFTIAILFNGISTYAQELDLNENFGWASSTTGGYGGAIIKVTNLNSSGIGSLTAAVSASGKRIVVFEVGGVIDLKGKVLKVTNPFMTIMGQTSPSPGITLINGGITIMSHDIIIQHLRIRPGSVYRDKNFDGLTTAMNANNVIIDHCSLTWAIDENLSASGPRFEGNTPEQWRKNTSHRITFSNNIIGEGLFHSVHQKGGHSMGTLIHDNVTDVLIMRNLYASNNDRNALFKGGSRGVFLNNYIYNPGERAIWYSLSKKEWQQHTPQIGLISVVGNILQLGPDSKKDVHLFFASNGPLKLFMEDNQIYGNNGVLLKRLFKGDSRKIVNSKPIWHAGLKILNSDDVESYILQNVGARPWDRDDQDRRILEDVFSKKGKIIDSESQVGGLKIIKSTKLKFEERNWDLKKLKKKD